MFRTQFDRVRAVTASGKRFKDTFSSVVTDNGSLDLVKDGLEDTYAFIQSFKDSVDLNLIMARYSRGDVTALANASRSGAVYGDFTEFPKTYAEALQAVISAEEQFASLPLDVRAKFGHDSNRFIASIGTPEWVDAVGLSPAKSVDKPIDNPQSAVESEVVK